jgi:tetratricopeptide (TPR) repeat protein
VTAGAYDVRSLDELERFGAEFVTIPVRIPFGIRSFGVNAYAASKEGGEVIEEHDELGSGAGRHEELYCVLRGRAAFTLDGEEIEAPAGTLVFVRDPAVKRHAVAREAGTTVLVVGGVPGHAFEPSPWESWLDALPHYDAKEYERAVDVLTRALAEHPDNPNVLYNLACCEALAGRSEPALAHLQRAVELDERARAWAREDSDFAAIRDDPGFPA